ncbi:MAG: succinate--CoA ligase subunit alpha [Vulcanimicrobiaceae bacterium]
MSIILDAQTRVLVQGASSREARTYVAYMRAYGANVVAAVANGRGGEQIDGIPVFESVRSALREQPAVFSVIFSPGSVARDAAFEAIAHEIGQLAILAPDMPYQDVAFVLERAHARGVRVFGPGTSGLISPGKAKLGPIGGQQPALIFRAGSVGIVSRSGGMACEIARTLTAAEIGQSTVIALGDDAPIGTLFVPMLEAFESDPQTQATVLFGQGGTGDEAEVARCVGTGLFRKPVVALICGDAIQPASAAKKRSMLRDAGVRVVDAVGEIAGALEHIVPEGRVAAGI